MVLVDSSVWIDYFNGTITPQTDCLDDLLKNEIVPIGDLIYTEVLQGFQDDQDFRMAQEILDSLLLLEMAGKDIVLRSSQNYRLLRRSGITVCKTIDIIIDTFYLVNDFKLLHSNRDYDAMEQYLGLRTI